MDKPVQITGSMDTGVAVDVASFGSRMSETTVPDPVQLVTDEPPPPEPFPPPPVPLLTVNLVNVRFQAPEVPAKEKAAISIYTMPP